MGRNGSILVVERDPELLAGWVKLLEDAGYRVIAATSFEEARNALKTTPSLLITDIRLGPYNGLHLIIRARASTANLPALVTTGYPDVGMRTEVERMGAVYVEKPVDPQHFLALVDDLLTHSDPQAQH
jgi:DNA-binding response OmpR family regulator